MRGALAVAALLGLPGLARAQSSGLDDDDQSVDVELFRPPADTMGYFAVPSSATLPHLHVSGSLWVSYANDPVVLVFEGERTAPVSALVDGDDGDGIIDDRLGAWIQAGIGLSRYFSFTIDMPLILWQDGYNLNTIDDPTSAPDPLIAAGSGDLRLIPKLVALDLDKVPVGIAVMAPLGLPTGNGGSFLGEEAVSFQPSVALEFADGSVRERAYTIRGALNAGYLARDLNRVRGVELGNAFVYGAALGIRPVDGLELITEFHGQILGSDTVRQVGEVNFGLKGLVGELVTINLGGGVGVLSGVGAPDWRMLGGVTVAPNLDPNTLDKDKDGIVNKKDQCVTIPEDKDGYRDEDGCPDEDNDRDGFTDDEDRCPDDPEDKDGFQDRDGCPDPDNDKDGLVDEEDRCVDDPENYNDYEDDDGCPDDKPPDDTDGDGFDDIIDRCTRDPEDFDDWEDDDGCPEPDNDGDSFLDADDACPNEREIFNGVTDEDGCPDEGRVVIEKSNIRILDKIYFDFNKATIQPISYSLLDEIAAVILGNPDLLKIRIEGHTDDVGSDVFNLKLSQSRAESVVAALVQRGVAPERLDAAGFGESRPLLPNDTEENRAENRRVEFLIVDRE